MSSQLASDGLINQAREVRAALGAMERKVAAMEALQEALLGNALPDNGGGTGSKVTGSKVMGSRGQRSRGLYGVKGHGAAGPRLTVLLGVSMGAL